MCGIFCAVGCSVPDSALENVFGALEHRGPDGRGNFTDNSALVTIAHTRLAVIDLATGAQPMQSQDGNVVLACNGEIYDFERIRSSLEAKGHRFRTKSDSEVILHLYEEFGPDCFEQLRGEFAFLLYDRKKRLLIAARDRFGIKPLYFSRLQQGFVFASEMKAIFASGLVDPKIDMTALDPLREQDVKHAHFPFEGIEQVPPASYVAVDVAERTLETVRYWSAEIPATSAEAVREALPEAPAASARLVLQELEEAVRLRLRADVPVGLYLSGGIDSAFVAALMKRNLSAQPHSFSISFEGSDRNERDFARRAANFVGTAHHEISVTKESLWANLADALWFSELPFVSLAPVGKFLLSKEARKHVTVVLTGEGADEVFLGYRTYFQKAIRESRGGSAKSARARAQTRRLKLGAFSNTAQRVSLLLVHKSQRQRLAAARASRRLPEPSTEPLINAVQEARIAAMPLDILCYLGDREEMAHSLEARLPFLDHKLYDAAKTIPVDFKMRAGLEKAVLRDAAKGLLPEDLRLRRKTGFMLTSDAVDFFGVDRSATSALRATYLSRQAFKRAQLFSYRAYLAIQLLARSPVWKRLPLFKRVRRDSNKVIMYMMQLHMLHDMFVVNPRWRNVSVERAR
ncbi:MAG: asparagine synthase (glutamine-hydrolyzing) [Sphingomicrobium sp.]